MAEIRAASHEARRRNKAEREAMAATAHLTSRQRLGVALAKLTQEDMDAVVAQLQRQAAGGDVRAVHALARLLDQSFGRPEKAAEDDGRDASLKELSEMNAEERAEYRAALIAEYRRQQQAAGDVSDPRTADAAIDVSDPHTDAASSSHN